MPQLAGEDILASDILPVQVRMKAVAETVNNSSALQNDDDFLFVLPIGIYSLDLWMHVTSTSNTPDIKLAWTTTGTMSVFRSCIGPSAATTDVSATTMRCSTHAVGTSVVYGVDNAISALIKEELVINVTVAGNLQLQWAQSVATAVNTTASTASRSRLMTCETF